uniref:Fungal lipase-like domain-containing protein n=1 Tax=Panagrolaimus sp. JU765 TaxID=591449 RepID=A0AC34R0X9_9BILA
MRLTSLVLLLVWLQLGSGFEYDEILARYKLWPMAANAFSSTPEVCIKDNFKNAELKNQYTVQCDMLNKADTCSSFSAVSHSDKAIILSFRGSIDDAQILEEGLQELLDPPSPFIGGGGVNKYFLDGFNKLWNAGMKNDFISLKNGNPGYELWVTGHSLGAAMASIAAATISKLGYFTSDKIKLVTYGEPRVGNADYAAAVDKLVPYAFRVVHDHDLVPHLPLKGVLGYTHHKSEVWYQNNMTVGASYVVCEENEGAKCSDSENKLNPDDHDYYFNTAYWFANHGCKGYNPYL